VDAACGRCCRQGPARGVRALSLRTQQAFGNGDLYVEKLYARARHIEVQIVVTVQMRSANLWDRDCSVQRQRQKLIEIAPARHLNSGLRRSCSMPPSAWARRRNIAASPPSSSWSMPPRVRNPSPSSRPIRACRSNTPSPRKLLGLDIVRLQLEIASGKTLAQLGITQDKVPAPRGMALQARINMETMATDGSSRPGGGTLKGDIK